LRLLHLPKAAGTSLAPALALFYRGPAFVFTGRFSEDQARFHALSAEEKRRLVFVFGHAPRRTGLEEIDEWPTITILREPVSRVISFCRHVREGKSPHLRKHFPPEQFDLDAFLESGDPELENLQSRLLLGGECPDEPEEAGRLAARKLADEVNFTAFGIFEELDLSLLHFRRVLRWPWLPQLARLNASRAGTDLVLTAEHRARIAQLNRADEVLYRQARRIWRERSKPLRRRARWLLPYEKTRAAVALRLAYSPFGRWLAPR
jgi:hypothetical protein